MQNTGNAVRKRSGMLPKDNMKEFIRQERREKFAFEDGSCRIFIRLRDI